MVARVRKAMAGPLPAVVAKMRLYMASPATHAVLLKPIKANIAEAHHQARPPPPPKPRSTARPPARC